MKSIVEEAPSILKAIEKAWIRAGNPREFSVKIFEDSQKNFFGMTSKNAKVGVFFEIEPLKTDGTRSSHQHAPATAQGGQRQPQQTSTVASQRPTQPSSIRPTQSGSAPTGLRPTQSKDENQYKKPTHTHRESYRDQVPSDSPHEAHSSEAVASEQTQERKKRIAWNDEMLTAVSAWLKELLNISNLGSHQPTLTVLDNRLIILFSTPLFDDPAKASDLYRSLSYLLIGMIRSKFKKEFRFLKIVLTDGSRDRDNES